MKNFYEQFKTPLITIIILFAALFVYTKLAGPISFSINNVNTTKTEFFTSDGKGEASGIPDTASVFLGITQQGTTISDAQNKANETAKKIINNIKNLGISEKDIKTTNYSVNPNYGSGDVIPMMYPIRSGQTITGYTVTQNVEVNVKPTDKVNRVIDAGTKSGANLVGGVNFTFSHELQISLEKKAREQAVTEAKEKAQNLASAAGIHLGKIVNVIESSNYPRMMPMAAGALKAEGDTTPTNVTPGENTVTINVTIYYETY